jgi:tetratricopeptide (TPR) repeat protein
MKPNFRTCPQCSTRNRLDKEFCVKCGEPLEGVKAGEPGGAPAKAKPGFMVSETDEGGSPIVPLVVVLLTLGVAFAAWRSVASAPPTLPPAAARPAETALPAKPASTPPPAAGSHEYAQGVAALQALDFENAIRLLRLAVASANRPEYRITLAEALERSGAISESLAEYEAAFNLESGTPRYASAWAKALNRAGRLTEAIRVYGIALQLDGGDLNNLREIVSLHNRNNNPALARPFLERLVALQPDDLVPRQDLAHALEAAGDLQGAVAQYQAILAAAPGADLSRALLSEVYMKQNRSADALALLDEGLAANASAAVLHREKGRVFDRLGRDREALAEYREYVRLAPGAPDLRAFNTRIEQLSGT